LTNHIYRRAVTIIFYYLQLFLIYLTIILLFVLNLCIKKRKVVIDGLKFLEKPIYLTKYFNLLK